MSGAGITWEKRRRRNTRLCCPVPAGEEGNVETEGEEITGERVDEMVEGVEAVWEEVNEVRRASVIAEDGVEGEEVKAVGEEVEVVGNRRRYWGNKKRGKR